MTRNIVLLLCVCTYFAISLALNAEEISTNSVAMVNPPRWLNVRRVNKLSDQVERVLEWDIRRVRVRWYNNETQFKQAVALPGDTASVLAVSKRNENTIHLGPRVNAENFDVVFAHELAHIVMFQKYKDAIPKWLEEGLANFAARQATVDYVYLAQELAKAPVDVRAMVHPFLGSVAVRGARFHYQVSTALIEMIRSKCVIADLLQLAVGEGLEKYLSSFCRIDDLNADLKRWVETKAKQKTKSKN